MQWTENWMDPKDGLVAARKTEISAIVGDRLIKIKYMEQP
jgi:hypothetical protein